MERKPHILLVDENTPVRKALEQALKSEHFRVVPAASGPEALSRLWDNQIDVALVDLNHSYHEGGWDLFQALAEAAPRLPIIVMSGRPDSFAFTFASRTAARLEKPLDLPYLFCLLDELTNEQVVLSHHHESFSQD